MAYFHIDQVNGSDSTGTSNTTQEGSELTPYKTYEALLRGGISVDDVILAVRGSEVDHWLVKRKSNSNTSVAVDFIKTEKAH